MTAALQEITEKKKQPHNQAKLIFCHTFALNKQLLVTVATYIYNACSHTIQSATSIQVNRLFVTGMGFICNQSLQSTSITYH